MDACLDELAWWLSSLDGQKVADQHNERQFRAAVKESPLISKKEEDK